MAKSDKRIQILDAAEKLFANKRYHELTLDDVAREAKVGKGTIYLYFKSKEDLVVQLVHYGHSALCGLIRGYIHELDIDFEERLVTVCSKISEFMLSHDTLFRIMREQEHLNAAKDDEHHCRMKAGHQEMIGLLVEILRDGAAQRQLRHDVDFELQAQCLLEFMRTRDWYPDTPGKPSIRQTVDLFINGFRAR